MCWLIYERIGTIYTWCRCSRLNRWPCRWPSQGVGKQIRFRSTKKAVIASLDATKLKQTPQPPRRVISAKTTNALRKAAHMDPKNREIIPTNGYTARQIIGKRKYTRISRQKRKIKPKVQVWRLLPRNIPRKVRIVSRISGEKGAGWSTASETIFELAMCSRNGRVEKDESTEDWDCGLQGKGIIRDSIVCSQYAYGIIPLFCITIKPSANTSTAYIATKFAKYSLGTVHTTNTK